MTAGSAAGAALGIDAALGVGAALGVCTAGANAVTPAGGMGAVPMAAMTAAGGAATEL